MKSDDEEPRVVAGNGAKVSGTNDFDHCFMSVSPSGEIFIADDRKNRLISFKNCCGTVVHSGVEGLRNVFCSPKGLIFLTTHGGRAVQELNGR